MGFASGLAPTSPHCTRSLHPGGWSSLESDIVAEILVQANSHLGVIPHVKYARYGHGKHLFGCLTQIFQGCMALHITSNTWCSQVSVGVLHPSKYGLVYPPWTQLLPEVVSASSASGAHSLVTGIYRYHTSKKTLCQRFGKFRVTSSETSRLVQELSRPSLTVAWLGLNNGSIPIFVGWVTIFSLRILDRNDVVIPPKDRLQLIKDPFKWWRFTFLFFLGGILP